jgi:dimeric dUTPase (all-alpha-NTP-PPase superfamily)
MREIFRLQWQLNDYTLAKIGLDYATTIGSPETKPVWLENYRKALSAELAELVRDVQAHGVGSQNGKIELVDMLHFLLSLSHIVALAPEEVRADATDVISFPEAALRTFLALDALQNSIKWKWWAKGGGYKETMARHAVLELWQCFDTLCRLFAMDFDTVKRLYVAKNAVNFKRQDAGYNEDTKTEADNEAIKV